MKNTTLNISKTQKLVSFILLVFCLVFINTLQAQNKQEDVVYLKNGSIIHGTIIENVIGVSIKIQTVDRSVWVFKMDEIEKITREEKPEPVHEEKLSKAKGSYIITSVGLIFDEVSFTSNLSAGYKWSPYFSTGGFICFDSYYGENLFAPMGLELRGEVLRGSVTPYWYVQAGLPVLKPANNPWETYKAGVMYQPGGGILFMLSKNLALLTELGYKVQYVNYKSTSWGITEQKMQIRNVTFKAGLQF